MDAAFGELTVSPRRDGTSAWLLELSNGAPQTAGSLPGYVEPAVAFLSARGGGIMVLPLSDAD